MSKVEWSGLEESRIELVRTTEMNDILFGQRSEKRRGWRVSKNLIDNEDSHLLLSSITPICACGCVCVIGGDC